ncbi:MAG: hypothetical protein PVJ68_06435 [Candidatus Thiodiazotropha sp.]
MGLIEIRAGMIQKAEQAVSVNYLPALAWEGSVMYLPPLTWESIDSIIPPLCSPRV